MITLVHEIWQADLISSKILNRAENPPQRVNLLNSLQPEKISEVFLNYLF